jgi:hypothetical protein
MMALLFLTMTTALNRNYLLASTRFSIEQEAMESYFLRGTIGVL